MTAKSTAQASDSSSTPSATRPPAGLGRPWPWNFLQTLFLTAAVFLLSQIVAGLVLGLAISVLSEGSPLANGTYTSFAAIVLAEALVVWLVVKMVRAKGIRLRELGFRKPHGSDLWMPLLAFVVYMSLFLGLIALLRQYVPGLDTEQRQDIGFEDATGAWQLSLVFLALVVAAPVAEEVLFRGFFFSSLRQRYSFLSTTILTSVIFGAVHLTGGEQGASLLWIAGIDTLVLSFVLCYLREKTGRLWAPILLHAMKNCLAFTYLFLISS